MFSRLKQWFSGTENSKREGKGSAMATQNDDRLKNNKVGPVLRSGDMADAAVDAAEIDNPGKEISVEDMRAYLRISTDGELILKRETMEECLGRPFEMKELEVDLSSFAGQIDINTDRARFYLNTAL